MLIPFDLRQPALRLPWIYCLWLTPLVFNLVTLHSVVRLKPHTAWQSPSQCWGYCFPSGCCHSGGTWSGWTWWLLCMGDDSTLRSQHLLSQFFLQSFLPQPLLKCVQAPLAPPLLEPRVCGCKWKFLCWPFKWLFFCFLIYSLPSLAENNSAVFHCLYLCTFWALMVISA